MLLFAQKQLIGSCDNRMRYSFDAIDIKGICDKIKAPNGDFEMDLQICKSQLK